MFSAHPIVQGPNSPHAFGRSNFTPPSHNRFVPNQPAAPMHACALSKLLGQYHHDFRAGPLASPKAGLHPRLLRKDPPVDLNVRNIILTGFMGTGKSTVGRLLAQRLGWQFLDTDDLIEQYARKTISRIFADDGEPAFRALESRVAREVAQLDHHVIATGGGIVLAEPNLRALESAGAVVLLEARPETIFQRVRHETHRPLLAKPDPRREIDVLLEARRDAYDRIQHHISTEDKTPEQVADDLIQQFSPSPAHPCRLQLNLGERSYPILIAADWIDRLPDRLAEVLTPRPCLLVTDRNVATLWAEPVEAALHDKGYRIDRCIIHEGEDHKTVATVEQIYEHLVEHAHSRHSGLIALGGGIVGDVAGFAAATYMRGIPYIQMPTTLLAMVDSSVGGKTGVNLPHGKNLVGAFWQPRFVGVELQFLHTLPDEELRAGLAEVIKYGVIADADLFEYLETHIDRALQRDPEVMTHLVRRSCEIKADVVAHDEREAGLRAILNFGHTFGHAAEALSHYGRLRHGEAVAMGMVAAAILARQRGWIHRNLVDRLIGLLRHAHLPPSLLDYPIDDYWRAMRGDKKVKDGNIRFVLPEALGRVRIVDDVSRQEIDRCLQSAIGFE